MMEYRGYVAKVEFDSSIDAFVGRVINTRDVITFEATSVRGLRKEFQTSVDDYIEFCQERGEEPDRPYSGEFRLRLDPALHRKVAITAQAEGESLNAFVARTLARRVEPKRD